MRVDRVIEPSVPIIGLTGGIGSGKTTVSDWFEAQGITVVDADVISRKLTDKGNEVLAMIAQAFGAWVIDAQGAYDRTAMREHIFAHPEARAKLNAIIHPRIQETILDTLSHIRSPYGILSAPLLLENRHQSPLYDLCDRVLVVDVPIAVQLHRASLRDGRNLSQIQQVIDAQIDREERLALADDVVDNSGDLKDLYVQLPPLHAQYLRLAGQH